MVLTTGDSFTAVRTVNNYYVMSTCYLRPVFVREVLSSFINVILLSYHGLERVSMFAASFESWKRHSPSSLIMVASDDNTRPRDQASRSI